MRELRRILQRAQKSRSTGPLLLPETFFDVLNSVELRRRRRIRATDGVVSWTGILNGVGVDLSFQNGRSWALRLG